jgi:hypothetical protein
MWYLVPKTTRHKSLLNREKSNGPRTEPWGTPQVMGKISENSSPTPTHCYLEVRYDYLINLIGTPSRPTEYDFIAQIVS